MIIIPYNIIQPVPKISLAIFGYTYYYLWCLRDYSLYLWSCLLVTGGHGVYIIIPLQYYYVDLANERKVYACDVKFMVNSEITEVAVVWRQ